MTVQTDADRLLRSLWALNSQHSLSEEEYSRELNENALLRKAANDLIEVKEELFHKLEEITEQYEIL